MVFCIENVTLCIIPIIGQICKPWINVYCCCMPSSTILVCYQCVGSVNNRTHCDIITSLSKQFPYFKLKEKVYQNYQQLFVMLEQYC